MFGVERMVHKEPEKFGPKFTYTGFGTEWYGSPFDSFDDAVAFLAALKECDPRFETVVTARSEGKERELDSARRSALWPDATAEQLTDRAALMARLLGLLAEFRSDMESLGFTY